MTPTEESHPDTYEWYYEHYHTLRSRVEALAADLENDVEILHSKQGQWFASQEVGRIARRLREVLK